MDKIILPENYNYVAAFLTLRCNMNCSYCINRQGEVQIHRDELSGKEWIAGLSRIETREDLPITIQGGEPTLHPDFYLIVNSLHAMGKKLDLLTNGEFDYKDFMVKVSSDVFKRKAPYANIRFSFHKDSNMLDLIHTVFEMQENGYSVGIWGLSHPDMEYENATMAKHCKELGIDFRIKEYLDETNGTYKYPNSMNGLKGITVRCKPSELLISPEGFLFRCHSDLYANVSYYDYILSKGIITLPEGFHECNRYGLCNPCDVKIKTNRLQEGGHTSVEIR